VWDRLAVVLGLVLAVSAVLAGALVHRDRRVGGQRRCADIRGHWGIEDRLHWVRDTDYDEDRSQVRTAAGPQIMAGLRNLAMTILRLAGTASIAAIRYQARRPDRPRQTITNC
jgi:hypothetical protein